MMVRIMKMSMRSGSWRGWQRSARRFRRDAGGVAALEFALILPLLLVMFFGMIDVSMGVGTDRKINMVAQTMADLTSRYASVTTTDFTNFFAIGDAIMTPYDKTPLVSTISQIYLDPATKTAKVQWSRGDAAVAKNTVVTVPADLVVKDASGVWAANQYLIQSEVSYQYRPIIGWVVPKAGITLKEMTFARPRQTTCITFPTSCAP